MADAASGGTARTTDAIPFAPSARSERLVAVGRFVLAASSLMAIWVDPTSPAKFAQITYGLLAIYSVYSSVLAIVALRRAPQGGLQRIVTHVVDLALFTAVIYLTEGATSPFFLYFVFALVSASLRFGTRGTIWTAAMALAIFLGMGLWASLVLHDPDVELNRFLIRSVYLAIMSVLLVYLGAHHEQHRRELSLLASWPRVFPSAREELIREVLTSARSILRATHAALTLQDRSTGTRTLAWFDGHRHFLDADWDGDSASIPLARMGIELREEDRPDSRPRIHGEQSVTVPVPGRSIRGTLLAGVIPEITEDDLVLGTVVAEMIASRLDELYYLERVTAAAVNDERVRLSRELHDGLLQSLTAVALKLRVAENILPRDPARAIEILSELRKAIVEDQRELRGFVSDLRDDEESSARKATSIETMLGAIIDRVGISWGIDVELVVEAMPESLPEAVRGGVVRFVQEALSNAGRHGHATRASVDVVGLDDAVRVRVRDNGKGFPFRGSFDLRTLDVEEIGPRTIRERIGELGGELRLVSTDEGATVEGIIPLVASGSAKDYSEDQIAWPRP